MERGPKLARDSKGKLKDRMCLQGLKVYTTNKEDNITELDIIHTFTMRELPLRILFKTNNLRKFLCLFRRYNRPSLQP